MKRSDNFNDVVLLVGAPRSGTTWIGKIFDSHPCVLYRHEPGAVQPCSEFPYIVPKNDFPRFADAARRYVRRMCMVRSVRTVGKRPVFNKRLSPGWRGSVRRLSIATLWGLEQLPLFGHTFDRVTIPDLVDPHLAHKALYAVKSVISLGRVGLYQYACPNIRIVLIVRHPCGFVASKLRGMRSGKMDSELPINALSQSEPAEHHGVTVEMLGNMDDVERVAWMWTLMNEKALNDLKGLPNVKIVLHDAISQEPQIESRALFDFCGLDFDRQTEAFLMESSTHSGKSSYFDVRRNSSDEGSKWKKELDGETIERICSVVRQSPAGRLFFPTGSE